MIKEIVFFDDPPDVEGELFPSASELSEEERVRNLEVFRLAAEFGLRTFTDIPKREKNTHERIAAVLELFDELSRRSELEEQVQTALEAAREVVGRPDDECAYQAIEFINAWHVRQGLEFPPGFLAELKALGERSKRENTVFKVNDVLIDLGETNEFAAMDRMDDLREELYG
ncbi:MAG: hypothetical protein O3A92_00125 [Verrucomicrobia bacterium]|nr:hypothetical protein [Verrucomicrobiota bacterium]